MADLSPQQWAAAQLRDVGAPVTPGNVQGMVGWANAEGGHWHNSAQHNPLNTTENAPGASSMNSVGVKSYPSWMAGIKAISATLRNGRYGGILAALHASNPHALAAAIGSSPWGTNGSLVAQTIGAASGAKVPSIPQLAQAKMGAGPRTQNVTNYSTSFTGGGTDWKGAVESALMSAASRPIDTSGKVSGSDPILSALDSAVSSGQYVTPQQAQTHSHTQAVTVPGLAQQHAASGMQFKGYVHPFPHATIGRTDMGVDLNMMPGSAIHAIGDSRVVHIYPNWYRGQPYVLFQLLNGPKAGKYYYIAEQFTPHVRPGQVVKAGDTVGVYAPSGTGIEAGWGTPGWQTEAQATTGYSEGQVTKSGQSFRSFLGV